MNNNFKIGTILGYSDPDYKFLATVKSIEDHKINLSGIEVYNNIIQLSENIIVTDTDGLEHGIKGIHEDFVQIISKEIWEKQFPKIYDYNPETYFGVIASELKDVICNVPASDKKTNCIRRAFKDSESFSITAKKENSSFMISLENECDLILFADHCMPKEIEDELGGFDYVNTNVFMPALYKFLDVSSHISNLCKKASTPNY